MDCMFYLAILPELNLTPVATNELLPEMPPFSRAGHIINHGTVWNVLSEAFSFCCAVAIFTHAFSVLRYVICSRKRGIFHKIKITS